MSEGTEKRDRYKKRVEDINESDMSLNERRKAIQRAQDGIYDSQWEKFQEDIDALEDEHKVFVIGGLFLLGGIFGAVAFPQNPGSSFFLGGLIGTSIGFLLATKTGIRLMEAMAESGQQQQQNRAKPSKPKQICQNCGWQNPQSNNFCHDCGTELGTSE